MTRIKSVRKIGKLYHYIVIDELGNQEEVKSAQHYNEGDKVRVIWTKMSDQYNTPYLVKIST